MTAELLADVDPRNLSAVAVPMNEQFAFNDATQCHHNDPESPSNMACYILNTSQAFRYRPLRLAAVTQSPNASCVAYTVLENSVFTHSAPLVVNLLNAAILRNHTKNPNASLSVASWPLPATLWEKVFNLHLASKGDIYWVRSSYGKQSPALSLVVPHSPSTLTPPHTHLLSPLPSLLFLVCSPWAQYSMAECVGVIMGGAFAHSLSRATCLYPHSDDTCPLLVDAQGPCCLPVGASFSACPSD